MKSLSILGTRGVPAKHGGFETFAEKLSLYLVEKDWKVTVYCQESAGGGLWEDSWHNVQRVHIPVQQVGTLGTIIFDLRATWHALSQEGLFLTLGYNTAVFNLLQRLKGQVNLINMDGIEWRRDKWGVVAKIWFWLNERIGCWIGNHLVADHPRIKDHLSSRVCPEKISMIPYGGDEVLCADQQHLSRVSVEPGKYSIVIARPEPENSILEIVAAFSSRPRNQKLVVLGKFDASTNAYHRKVMAAASEEVIFPGAIYEASVVQALRFFSCVYIHGHRVGGTNPSLVEALGASCAVIAHDNCFNRWVAGPDAAYFENQQDCSVLFDQLLHDNAALEHMQSASRAWFKEHFTWEKVLHDYETLFTEWYPSR